MASLIENLIEVLRKEESEYQVLIELSRQKSTAIVQGSLEELTRFTDEEQIVVSRIHHLEKTREETIHDIADVLNRDVENLKLTDIIRMLENRAKEHELLAEIHEKLKATIAQMTEINEHNKALLANALEMVEFDMNIIQAMKAAPETANYNKGAYNTGTLMGGVSSFDTKQ